VEDHAAGVEHLGVHQLQGEVAEDEGRPLARWQVLQCRPVAVGVRLGAVRLDQLAEVRGALGPSLRRANLLDPGRRPPRWWGRRATAGKVGKRLAKLAKLVG
jgi:hypothetical protein